MVDVVFDNRSRMAAILILDFVPFLSEKDPTDIDSFVVWRTKKTTFSTSKKKFSNERPPRFYLRPPSQSVDQCGGGGRRVRRRRPSPATAAVPAAAVPAAAVPAVAAVPAAVAAVPAAVAAAPGAVPAAGTARHLHRTGPAGHRPQQTLRRQKGLFSGRFRLANLSISIFFFR